MNQSIDLKGFSEETSRFDFCIPWLLANTIYSVSKQDIYGPITLVKHGCFAYNYFPQL